MINQDGISLTFLALSRGYQVNQYGHINPCPACGSGSKEKGTPACKIYDDKRFTCFSCGAHGDAVDLVAYMDKTSTSQAIAALGVRQSAPRARSVYTIYRPVITLSKARGFTLRWFSDIWAVSDEDANRAHQHNITEHLEVYLLYAIERMRNAHPCDLMEAVYAHYVSHKKHSYAFYLKMLRYVAREYDGRAIDPTTRHLRHEDERYAEHLFELSSHVPEHDRGDINIWKSKPGFKAWHAVEVVR